MNNKKAKLLRKVTKLSIVKAIPGLVMETNYDDVWGNTIMPIPLHYDGTEKDIIQLGMGRKGIVVDALKSRTLHKNCLRYHTQLSKKMYKEGRYSA